MTPSARILVVSDTHGESALPVKINEHVDVVIHCGDLTEESKLSEFYNTLDLLKNISAPLKLIIAGNHDWTLDEPIFRKKLEEARLDADDPAVKKAYGGLNEARQLLLSDDAINAGVRLLDEGVHEFTIMKGRKLTVYASPYTPSVNDWGFQYNPCIGHEFKLKKDIDVAITHGPPRGIFDTTSDGKRLGCPHLFAAIVHSQPRIHCFGHVHNSWGARYVTWRPEMRRIYRLHTKQRDKSVLITIDTDTLHSELSSAHGSGSLLFKHPINQDRTRT